MLRISKKADYGLLLLAALSQEGVGTVVSLKAIAETQKMPYKYLSQIAPQLVETGILGSKEGAGGGYFLTRDPSAISVGDVLEALEGPVAPVACPREECTCEPYCEKDLIEKMAVPLVETVKQFTLADLISSSQE
ncbi:Rrf2 family transcriptional regulator [Patescibacteria group bacterium]|nr:Rrf2 family transcriptional regulator [Patescibacteria group bacterium]